MRKINIVQLVVALLGLFAVLLLPYFMFSYMGIPFFSISAIKVIGGMYPIFLIPVFGMLLLALLSNREICPISIIAGVVVLIIQIAFVVLRKYILLSGDLTAILNKANALLELVAGASTRVEIQRALASFLRPTWGFYLGVAFNVIYIVAGVLFSGGSVTGGGQSRTNGGGTSTGGRRTF